MYRRHDDDYDEDEDESDEEDEEGDDEEDGDDEKDEDSAGDERGGAKQGERNADGGCEEDVEAASRAFVLSALEVAGCPELADRFHDEAVDAEALMLFDREDLVELGVPPAAADRLLDFLNQGL